MVLQQVSRIFQDMKLLVDPHFACLTALNSGICEISDEMIAIMEQLHEDMDKLSVQIHHFALKCRLDSASTKKKIKDLKKELSLCLDLFQKMAEKKEELMRLPQLVALYLVWGQRCFNELLDQLRKETKAKGKLIIDAAAGISVQVAGDPAVESALQQVSPPPEEVQSEFAPQEGTAPEHTSPAGTSGTGMTDLLTSPKERFPLPGLLENLRLEPEERELFFKVLEFIAAARERGDKSQYDLDSFKQRMYVGTVAGLDVILRRFIGKNPGKLMAELFEGNEQDALKYVRTYHHPDPKENNILTKEHYPLLKEQVLAMLGLD